MLNVLTRHLFSVTLCAALMFGSLHSMEKASQGRGIVRPVSADISDFAWTPNGTQILVGLRTKKLVQIYENNEGRLDLVSTFKTAAPVVKLACSAAQNAVAVGLTNGMVEFFLLREGTVNEDTSIIPTQKEIHEICWIGKTPYVLVYLKDREPEVPGMNVHYGHTSVLRIFDSRNGSLIKEFTLPSHVLKIAVAPSGNMVAIVTDLHNRRNDILSLDEQSFMQELQLYSLSENFEVKSVMQKPYRPESPIADLAWSPHSTTLAVLLDTGALHYFSSDGKSAREKSFDTCKYITGKIDWSPVNDCLSIPSTRNTVQIVSPSLDESRETISLGDYLIRINPQKPLFATKVAWSSSTPDLAILCADLGYGAGSPQRNLVVVRSQDRPLKRTKKGENT